MRALDLTGQRFGRWTAWRRSAKRGGTFWTCVCDCGVIRDVSRNHLRSGHSKSCGCLKSEVTSESNSAKLDGHVFGRLTVLERVGSERTNDKRKSDAKWRCLCACGSETTATTNKLQSGAKVSCGCAFLDAITTHGKSRTRVYGIWQHMRLRCSDKADAATRPHYFDKGIRVCDRWQTFENFLADMGEPTAKQSLDRIDPSGNYEPGNCRWATMRQQQRNKTTNKVVEVNGATMLLSDAIAYLRATAKPLHCGTSIK